MLKVLLKIWVAADLLCGFIGMLTYHNEYNPPIGQAISGLFLGMVFGIPIGLLITVIAFGVILTLVGFGMVVGGLDDLFNE